MSAIVRGVKRQTNYKIHCQTLWSREHNIHMYINIAPHPHNKQNTAKTSRDFPLVAIFHTVHKSIQRRRPKIPCKYQ